jgi:sarcosine oxidase subunit beta
MSSTNNADIVILGAGVIGTSIAFHLACRSPGRIVVLDRDVVAAGGSGRSSALIRMHYSFAPEVELALRSLEIFENWEDVVERPGHFRQVGFVRLVPETEIGRLEAQVEMQRGLGANVQLISGQELGEIEPDWHVNDVALAAYEPESGYGDGAVVAGDFLSRAREMGVEYRPHTSAMGLRVEGGRVRAVETDDGIIEAPVVVSAIGPWTRPLLSTVHMDLPIEPEYHQVAVLQNLPGMKSEGCACIDSITRTYFRSDAGDLTLVGDFYGDRDVDPSNFQDNPPEEDLADLVMSATGRIPALADAGIQRAVTGIYDVSPDTRPILGELPEVSGLYVAAGFSGMGFKISPAIGMVMSELLLDGEASTVDITVFRPGRFADGEPIEAQHEYEDD